MFNYIKVEGGVIVGVQSSTEEIVSPGLVAVGAYDDDYLGRYYADGVIGERAPVPENPAAKEKAAAVLVNKIVLQKSVEADLDSLSDEDLATITYLYDEWVGDGRLLKLEVKVRYEGVLYRVLQAHNTQAGWEPPNVPALFTPFRDPVAGPQPWVQPTGAQDVYAIGERVTHDNPNDAGNIWIYESAIDANTTEPGRDGTFDRWWTPVSLA